MLRGRTEQKMSDTIDFSATLRFENPTVFCRDKVRFYFYSLDIPRYFIHYL